jgi:hypothetical protein
MPAPPPLVVPAFTRAVAQEVRAVAQALPWRPARGVDAERVFWVDVAGRERIGAAWTPAAPGEPAHWMIALANSDRRPVSRARVREVVRIMLGPAARHEVAPPFEGAPHMTLVRVIDDHRIV